jgi:hypothetical protein
MKTFHQSALLLLLICTTLLSCTKEVTSTNTIVAGNEKVIMHLKTLIKSDDEFYILNQNIEYYKNDTFVPLNFNEFKYLFNQVKNKKRVKGSLIKRGNNENSQSNIKSNSIKTFDEYEDDPRKAGYYHAVFPFYTSYYTGLNNAINFSGRYDMHLDFNTDNYGRVIGNPSISFTGNGLVSFSQINASNITFDSKSGNNYFTITESTVFGFQFGGATIGWTSRSNYFFTVNMDDTNTKNAVYVEQN